MAMRALVRKYNPDSYKEVVILFCQSHCTEMKNSFTENFISLCCEYLLNETNVNFI